MGFSRQEYCSGLPFPFPGYLANMGSNPRLLPCRQILSHLSHQGDPRYCIMVGPESGHWCWYKDTMWRHREEEAMWSQRHWSDASVNQEVLKLASIPQEVGEGCGRDSSSESRKGKSWLLALRAVSDYISNTQCMVFCYLIGHWYTSLLLALGFVFLFQNLRQNFRLLIWDLS